jgi:hypothetical protein
MEKTLLALAQCMRIATTQTASLTILIEVYGAAGLGGATRKTVMIFSA